MSDGLTGFSYNFPFFLSFPIEMSNTDFKLVVLQALDTMKMGEFASGPGGKFKAIAYDKAMKAIKAMPGPLTSAVDVKGLDGVGAKIYDKVVEIVATGGLAAAERMKERTNIGGIKELLDVHGIGPVKAKELLDAGYKSVADLRAGLLVKPDLLNDTQKLGLKYYEAGIERIPRAEMTQHEKMLLSALPSSFAGVVVGSYRRGAANSGDVDMLVTYPEAMTEKAASEFFRGFVADLTRRGYILDKLVAGPKKWMGYVHIGDGTPRRLDLLLTPPSQYGYAILYFTGSDKFNIGFRKWCLSHGYTLNEHEMKPTGDKPKPPALMTEEAVFDFIGLKFVPPTERVDANQIVPK